MISITNIYKRAAVQIDPLKTFIAVVETGGFTRAAAIVNLSQAAVSLQIKRLEEELGTSLFFRKARSFQLTPAGKSLLQYARKIVKTHDRAILEISRPELSGTLRFGAPEDYVTPFITKILSRFSRKYPGVNVEVVCELSMKLKEAVDTADLDFALCTEIFDGGTIIFREPMVWISSHEHLQHKTVYPLPLGVSYEGCAYRRWCIRAVEQAGFTHRIKYSSPTSTGIKAAVQAGLAVAVMGITNTSKNLLVLDKKDKFPDLPDAHVILHKAPGHYSPMHMAFEKCVKETFSDISRELGLQSL